MEDIKRRSLIQKIIIFALLIASIVLIVFFVKDIIIPFVKFEIDGNIPAAQELLRENRILGILSVVLLPGVQMVVVFISAEFIQIAAGLAYNPFLAMGLLDLGVLIGASIIWVLVHTFKFDTSMFAKSTKKIAKYAKMNRNTQLLMFLLFFMPFIPYGAICYYGSSTKISYRRYIITCGLGCLPSIITSIFLGKAIKQFITEAMPIWLLIIIVLGCAIILFLFIFFLLRKYLFKEAKGTPDSPLFSIIRKYAEIMCHNGKKYNYVNLEKLNKITGPSIVIANHPGPFDYYRVYNAFDDAVTGICNRHIVSGKIGRLYAKEVGFIPKKLFDPDLETILQTRRMLKKGYSVALFPEGRLSIDGTNYPYDNNTATFVKMMKANVVVLKIKKAYFAENKWRSRRYNTPIDIVVEAVLSKDEIERMNHDELNKIIKDGISFNDFDYVVDDYSYKQPDKAVGLENVLYMCPKCKKMYMMESVGNTLHCKNCDSEFVIGENYFFDNTSLPTIHEFYERIKYLEKGYIKKNKGILLETKVNAKVFYPKSKKYEKVSGICILTKDEFKFNANKGNFSFTKKVKDLQAIAFSVNQEFEMYHNERLHYFYPVENKAECTRWALIFDVLKEIESHE